MNKIQKSLTALLLCLICFQIAQAQGPRRGNFADRTPEEIAERQTTAMTKQLELTEEQAAQIKDLNLNFAKKRKEVMEANEEEREAIRESMKTVQDEHAEALKTVLTEEQLQKWEELRKERRPDSKGDKGRGKRGKKSDH